MRDNNDRRMTIAVLEDNPDRIAEMDRLLADKFPFFRRIFARTSAEAIAWLAANWSHVICVCLDHDLEPCANAASDADPGTGRQVSDYLAERPAAFPVVIHTSNHNAAIAMETELLDAGWNVSRVTPFEDLEWLGTAWLPLVRQSVVQTASEDRSLNERFAATTPTAHEQGVG